MNAKKIICLILALLMGLGLLSPLLYIMADAATSLELGSATDFKDSTDHKEYFELASGTPDINIFTKPGIYDCKIIKGPKLQCRYRGSGEDIFTPFEVTGSLISFGGLNIITKPGVDITEGQDFKLSIIEKTNVGELKEPSVTLIDAENNGRIYENRTVTLKFVVTDYNNLSEDVSPKDIAVSYNGAAAFPLKSGANPTVKKITGSSVYATFEVSARTKYSGHGNSVSFEISYFDKHDNAQLVRCQAKIPNTVEAKDDDDDDDDDDEETEPLTPYIIVENYSYGGDSVTAGKDFELNLTLRNTSETHTLENIVMNISPQGVFSMGSSSNTIYLPTLHAGSTKTHKITINTGLTKVTDDEDANSIAMKFDFQYVVDKVRKTGSSNENITIPVNFPDRFELSPPEMDGEAYEGEDWYIYLPMVNKGRSSVYNLMAYVKGEGISNAGQRQYVGNVNAGSQTGADFTLNFDGPGKKKGEIIVTYEDANMNPKEVTMPFEVTVEEMYFPDEDEFPDDNEFPDGMEPSEPTDAEPEEKFPKGPVALTAIVVCGISAYITVLKAKAKRSIFADEEI